MPTFRLKDQRWAKYLNFQTIDFREGESETDLTVRCMEADPFPGATLLNDFRTEFVSHYINMETAKVVRNDDGESEWQLDVYANVKAVLTKDVEAESEKEARDLFDLELTFLMPAFDGENPGMWLYEWDPELEDGQDISCEMVDIVPSVSPAA
jgi:hypothetical protein